MITVYLRFYEELNDCLPTHRRKLRFARELLLPTTVKDLIESCGVPHTEVDLVLRNGESASFSDPVADGDDISIYPVFESLDVSSVTRLGPQRPLRDLCFVADAHLGKLARKLRILGLDVAYHKEFRPQDILQRAVQEKRVVLTRNRHLLMNHLIQRGYWVRSQNAPQQVREVIRRFDLEANLKPFTRCARCNAPLQAVSKAEVQRELEPRTRRYYQEFARCRDCRQIYWKGSHFNHLEEFVERVRS